MIGGERFAAMLPPLRTARRRAEVTQCSGRHIACSPCLLPLPQIFQLTGVAALAIPITTFLSQAGWGASSLLGLANCACLVLLHMTCCSDSGSYRRSPGHALASCPPAPPAGWGHAAADRTCCARCAGRGVRDAGSDRLCTAGGQRRGLHCALVLQQVLQQADSCGLGGQLERPRRACCLLLGAAEVEGCRPCVLGEATTLGTSSVACLRRWSAVCRGSLPGA